MRVVDRGRGVPVVLVPGIQGRWEWMAPAVDALARRCRTITFSLADEPSAEWPARGSGFDAYVEQVAQALDASHLDAAVICGVSYGGLVAAAFARRYPERVSGLALVSALPPSWRPDPRARFFMRSPNLLLPLFLLSSLRLHREIAAAHGGWWRGVWPSIRQGARSLAHFPVPARMARRAGIAADAGVEGLASVHVPVLVVTGEPGLDRVVPTALTAEYTRIWPHATAVTLEHTGHLGLVTRPDEFADVIVRFATEAGLKTGGYVAEAGLKTGGYRDRRDRLADVIRDIPGAVGSLECLVDRPKTAPRAAVVFAHPLPTEGGTMHTKVVYQSAKALADIGCVVLRFNFRGVGRSVGTWDEGRGEMDDYRRAVDYMAAAHPGLELWAAGFSFGSYIAMTTGADDDRICAMIGIAPPVDRYEFGSVKLSVKPKFVVHGEMDELISLKLVRQFYAELKDPKELVEIDSANHLFDGQASEVGDALRELLADFSCTTP